MKKQTDNKTDEQPLTAVVVPATMEDNDPLAPDVYDPALDRAEILKPVRSMRTYLRRLLNEDGSYKRKYNQQLKLTAQSLMLLEDCYLEIMTQKGEARYVSTETSREGNARNVRICSLNVNACVCAYMPVASAIKATISPIFFIYGCKGTKNIPYMQKYRIKICVIKKKAVLLHPLLKNQTLRCHFGSVGRATHS